MIIRRADEVHLDGAARLAVLHSGGERVRWIERFGGDLDDGRRCLLVAVRGGLIVGYGRACWFEPHQPEPAHVAPRGYYLVGLVVDPDHRRRGIGGALIGARLDWARELGAHEAWFFTNAANVASQRLHQRFGFQEVTRDFVFPGVSFEGGVGILGRTTLV
ncbi:MAG: N-acetyltransferase family protein [Solirubrobacteraceae bacterium]